MRKTSTRSVISKKQQVVLIPEQTNEDDNKVNEKVYLTEDEDQDQSIDSETKQQSSVLLKKTGKTIVKNKTATTKNANLPELELLFYPIQNYDLYYHLTTPDGGNFMYFLHVPVKIKHQGKFKQLVKIGFTNNLLQRVGEISQSLVQYVRNQGLAEGTQPIVQPVMIAKIRSQQKEKEVHKKLRFYQEFNLPKNIQNQLDRISGFTEIYFFSTQLVLAFKSALEIKENEYEKIVDWTFKQDDQLLHYLQNEYVRNR